MLAAGAIPVTSLTANAEPVRVLGPVAGTKPDGRFGDASGILGAGLRLNGRGLAAADVDNNGRMDVAVNTIGGKLALLRSTGPDRALAGRRAVAVLPGAVVTIVLPGGQRLVREVQAGGSYLSSEDPRVHFGLGVATKVTRLTVRYPWGGESSLAGVRADRILTVAVPAQPPVRELASSSYVLAGCTPANLHGRSVARVWDDAAVAELRAGDAAEPMQARDLFDASAAMWDAWAAYDPPRARLLRHRESRSDRRAGCAQRCDQLRGLPAPRSGAPRSGRT